jgi:hypothetical protein
MKRKYKLRERFIETELPSNPADSDLEQESDNENAETFFSSDGSDASDFETSKYIAAFDSNSKFYYYLVSI